MNVSTYNRFPKLVVAAVAAACMCANIASASEDALTEVDGELDEVPEWAAAVEDLRQSRLDLNSCERNRAHCGSSVAEEWHDLMSFLRGAELGSYYTDQLTIADIDSLKVQVVNGFFNQLSREAAPGAGGTDGVWVDPWTLLSSGGRGDSEDYALAKYETLRRLDFDTRDMGLISGRHKAYNYDVAALFVRMPGSERIVLATGQVAPVPLDLALALFDIRYIGNEKGVTFLSGH